MIKTENPGVRPSHFAAGHVVYMDDPSIEKMRNGLEAFVDGAVGGGSGK